MNERQKEVMQAQVDREKEILNRLKLVYAQAQDDCANKIIDLSRRRDMENLQSIIYQKKYQEALKGQIDNILDELHNNEYQTVSEYLHDCYENGYLGAMYDLAGQDIPLIMPIDQQQVIKAVELDAKLTTKKRYTDGEGNKVSLYEKLGANVDELKDDIRFQVSRGIVNGSSWNQIGAELAKGMKHTPFEKAMNRTVTIARTEGHRIQCQAAMDAQYKAKSAGADVLKQWDSTLDGRTRETHRRLDGQIREVDEYFEVDGKKAMYPGGFGDPSEDCNCRCAMLQRARWALDEEELDELKKRAEFFELDKTKDFEEFKEKYLGISDETNVKVGHHKDVTKKWMLEKELKEPKTSETDHYTYKGKTYYIDGVNVKQNNSPREIEVAELLSKKLGFKVEYVPEVNGKIVGVHSPDYLVDDKYRWDLKELKGGSKDAIRNAISPQKEQADNFVIDITHSKSTLSELKQQAIMVFYSFNTKFVNTIIILKDDEIIEILRRT